MFVICTHIIVNIKCRTTVKRRGSGQFLKVLSIIVIKLFENLYIGPYDAVIEDHLSLALTSRSLVPCIIPLLVPFQCVLYSWFALDMMMICNSHRPNKSSQWRFWEQSRQPRALPRYYSATLKVQAHWSCYYTAKLLPKISFLQSSNQYTANIERFDREFASWPDLQFPLFALSEEWLGRYTSSIFDVLRESFPFQLDRVRDSIPLIKSATKWYPEWNLNV